jgi:uncharacterized protein YbjT (DUF2867 family)
MEKKKVIITGATGMVGGYALDRCLESEEVSRVTSIVRRPSGKKHVKLVEVIHKDFTDYSTISENLRDQDVSLYCIGVYTGAVPNDVFERITVDFTIAFADALLEQSRNASFCFLSGAGADRTEKSRMIFARSKGKAENYLLKQNFGSVHIFRPGYIYPVEPRKEPNTMYRVQRVLWPLIGKLFPGLGVNSDDLGHAIADVGIHGSDRDTFENRNILEHVKKMSE